MEMRVGDQNEESREAASFLKTYGAIAACVTVTVLAPKAIANQNQLQPPL
jgi:hypothetical protein